MLKYDESQGAFVGAMKDEDGNIIANLAEDMKKMSGVSLVDSNGQLRDTYDVIKDVSEVWDTLDKNTQSGLLEKMAGKRHSAVLASLLADFDVVENALADLVPDENGITKALGSSEAMMKEYSQSLEYQANELKENVKAMYRALIPDTELSGIFSGLNSGIQGITSVVGGSVEKFGTVRTVIMAVSAAALLLNGNLRSMATSFGGKMISNLTSCSTTMLKLQKTMKAQDFANKRLIVSNNKKIQANNRQIQANNRLGVSSTKLVAQNSRLAMSNTMLSAKMKLTAATSKILKFSLGGLSMIGGMLALNIGMNLVDSIVNADKHLKEFNETTMESIKTSKEKIDSNNKSMKSSAEAMAEIEELEKKINNTSNAEEKIELESQLVEKKQALIDMMPEVASGMDAESASQQELNSKLQEYIDLKERENQLEARKQESAARDFLSENKVTSSSANNNLTQSIKSEADVKFLIGQLDKLSQVEENASIKLANGTETSAKQYRSMIEARLKDSEEMFNEEYLLAQQTYEAYSALDPKRLTSEQKEYMKNFENMEETAKNYKSVMEDMPEFKFDENSAKSSKKDIDELVNKLKESENVLNGLPKTTQDSINELVGNIHNGTLTVGEFEEAMFEFELASKKAYGENEAAVKSSMDTLLSEFSKGNLTTEEFTQSMKAMEKFTTGNMKSLSKESKKCMDDLLNSFLRGEIGVEDFSKSIDLLEKMGNIDLSKLSKSSKDTVNKMNKDFSSGKMSVSDFENATNAMALYAQQDFSNLDKASKKTLDNLISKLPEGKGAAKILEDAITGMSARASIDMSKLDSNAQTAVNNIVNSFNNGKMSPEEFANAMSLMSVISTNGMDKLDSATRDAINTLMSEFASGKINASDFANQLMSSMGIAGTSMSNFSAKGQAELMNLIGQFLTGKISATELQQGVDALKTNPEFATAIGKTMGSVKTSSDTAKGAVDGVKTSMNGVNNKTVTLTVNKVETTTKKTIISNPTYTGGGGQRPAGLSLEDNTTSIPNTPNTNLKSQNTKSNKSAILSSNSPLESGSTPSFRDGENKNSTQNGQNSTSSSNNVNLIPQNPNLRKSDAEQEAERQAEEAARKKEQMEQDAVNKIKDLRDKLAEALIKKTEEQRDKELKILDDKLEAIEKNYDKEKELLDKHTQSKIQALKDEKDALNGDRTEDYQGKVDAIQKELEMWKGNDSAYAKGKVKELEEKLKEAEKELKNKQIDDEIEALEKEQAEKEKALEEQYNAQVEAIEKEKEAKDKYWEEKLSDENIYNEANKILLQGNMNEMLEMIKTYAPEWDDIGLLFGESLADGIKRALQDALNAKDFMDGKKPEYNETKNPWENSKPSSGGGSSSGNTNGKKGKGKVVGVQSSLNVREGAGTNYKKIGALWKNEEIDILDEKNGWYFVEYYSESAKKKKKGWSSGKYIQKFHTGGIIGRMTSDEGVAMVQSGERVLSRTQTSAFEELVGWLPNFEDIAKKFSNLKSNISNDNSNQSVAISNTFNVYPNDETDTNKLVDNVIKGIENKVRRQGVTMKPNRIFKR